MGIVDTKRPRLISPFTKKTNIHCSLDDDSSSDSNNCWRTQHKELYRVHPTDEDNDSENTKRGIVLKKNRKRRSNDSLIPPLSVSIARHHSPLPPLPTVENFMTILYAPASPDSSYFSARSTSSSASSSQSTLNSILLDDVVDHLANTRIMKPCLSSDSNSSNSSSSSSSSSNNGGCISSSTSMDESSITKNPDCDDEEIMNTMEQKPPPVPPKDPVHIQSERMLMMDPQNSSTMNINNKQKKRSIMVRPTQMRITTSDISNSQFYPSPKSADAASENPLIPPRRSSLPIPLPPSKQSFIAAPPMPADAKQKANTYNSRRPEKILLDER